MTKIRKAVIPVAGFGTRFLPATIASPKEMLPIVDTPVIQYIVEEMVNSGIEEIIFITGRGKRAIEDHFDPSFELEYLLRQGKKFEMLKEVKRISSLAKFVYVRQANPKGNGHALLCAKGVVGDEPFAFSYGDDIIDAKVPAIKQMIEAYNKYHDLVIGGVEVPRKYVNRYGIINPKTKPVKDKIFEVQGVVEKPDIKSAPSNIGAIGRYIFNPDIFEALEKVKPGKGGEIWLVDGVNEIFKKKAVYGCTLDGKYYDCGNKVEYMKCVINYSLRHPEVKNEVKSFLKNLSF